MRTLHDTGGKEVLDFSGADGRAGFDLRPGGRITTHYADGKPRDEIHLSYRTEIETLIATPFDDQIRLNASRNLVDGDGGTDTVVYAGDRDDYLVRPYLHRDGREGLEIGHAATRDRDWLLGVEHVVFDDGAFSRSAAGRWDFAFD